MIEAIEGKCSKCLFFLRDSEGLPCLEGLAAEGKKEASAKVVEAQRATKKICQRWDGSKLIYRKVRG